MRFLNACIEDPWIYSTTYTGCDDDKRIDSLTFCSKGWNEWVILIDFLPSCNGGESIMIVCESNALDDI